MKAETRLIEKYKELFGQIVLHNELYRTPIMRKIESEIVALEKKLEQEAITDSDIMAWAKELFHNLQTESPIIMAGCNGAIIGAKAMRDNKIKHIK